MNNMTRKKTEIHQANKLHEFMCELKLEYGEPSLDFKHIIKIAFLNGYTCGLENANTIITNTLSTNNEVL